MTTMTGSAFWSRSSALLVASAGMAVATGFGSWVSLAKDVRAEPFGIDTKLSVPTSLKLGLGSGLAAPWPMPLVALATAMAALRAGDSPRPARVCQTIGWMLFCGTLVEPVTWSRRLRHPLIKATVAANLFAGAALVVAGSRAAVSPRSWPNRRHPGASPRPRKS